MDISNVGSVYILYDLNVTIMYEGKLTHLRIWDAALILNLLLISRNDILSISCEITLR